MNRILTRVKTFLEKCRWRFFSGFSTFKSNPKAYLWSESIPFTFFKNEKKKNLWNKFYFHYYAMLYLVIGVTLQEKKNLVISYGGVNERETGFSFVFIYWNRAEFDVYFIFLWSLVSVFLYFQSRSHCNYMVVFSSKIFPNVFSLLVSFSSSSSSFFLIDFNHNIIESGVAPIFLF